MEIRRHVASALILASFLAFNTATSKGPSSSSSSPSPASSVGGSLSSVPDVNIGSLRASLGCDKNPSLEGCRVLTDFEGADPLTALPSEGRDVWYGESHGLGGAANGNKELFFLQLENSSGSTAGSARSLIPENPTETADATTLLATVKRGAAAPKRSPAADFMRTAASPKGPHMLQATMGKSATLADPSGVKVFLRQKGDRVLIVEWEKGNLLGHAKGGAGAVAWCAELWKLK